jgi:hypothetical protein
MSLPGGSSRHNRFGSSVGRLAVGGGYISRIERVTASVNPASIAATTKAGTAVTVAGVAVGDVVVATPPTDLEDDLIPAGARVTAANTVTVYLYNASGGAVDGAAKDWSLLVIGFAAAS